MAKSRQPGRRRATQTLSTDVRRFRQLINVDEIFGTHTPLIRWRIAIYTTTYAQEGLPSLSGFDVARRPGSVANSLATLKDLITGNDNDLHRWAISPMTSHLRELVRAPSAGLDFQTLFGHYQSPAIRAGGLIFCSGMLAINPETGEREHGTVASETRRIFENLKLLLESAGSSLSRIVQVHALIYDRIEYDVLNRVYRHYVPHEPPCRTVWSVQIEAGLKVQLDIIAAV